jgi:hypothetical protein
MVPEHPLQNEAGRMPALRTAGTPGLLWFTGWTLLTTAAIAAALVATPPLAVMFMWLINLGAIAGLWSPASSSTVQTTGFLASLALVLAGVQGYLLRRFVPRAMSWFVATGAGMLLGGLAIWLILRISPGEMLDLRFLFVVMLPMGLALGLTHWLYLRRFLPNAFWIILIDVLAGASGLLAGESFTNLAELMILFLPGAITGLGLWLLLSQAHPKITSRARVEASLEKSRRFPRIARAGLGLAAMVPLFFVCIWVYAASQLALAKNEGIYPTVEEAVIATNSQGFGGAEVVHIENVHASRMDQPHVWFGGAEVYLDRVPEGGRRDWYLAGSYYIHVREGWVFVGEGAFPEFIGWVMELYNMEGVQ